MKSPIGLNLPQCISFVKTNTIIHSWCYRTLQFRQALYENLFIINNLSDIDLKFQLTLSIILQNVVKLSSLVVVFANHRSLILTFADLSFSDHTSHAQNDFRFCYYLWSSPSGENFMIHVQYFSFSGPKEAAYHIFIKLNINMKESRVECTK